MESPGPSKVGAIPAKTSLDQLFLQHKCTVMDEFNEKQFAAPINPSKGTFHSTRTTRLGGPLPVSLLSWSRGGLVNGPSAS